MNSPLSAPWEPVLEYWFGDSLERGWPQRSRNGLWFRADETVDRSIEALFAHLVEAALFSELVDWEADPHGRLALLLLLDQFPRNIFRGTARAFAGDPDYAPLAQARQAGSEGHFWVIDDSDVAGSIPYLPKG